MNVTLAPNIEKIGKPFLPLHKRAEEGKRHNQGHIVPDLAGRIPGTRHYSEYEPTWIFHLCHAISPALIIQGGDRSN